MIDEDAFYAEVGRRIRRERERRVWTQDMLSAKVPLTRSSISNIEAGRQKFLLHDLAELAYAFGVLPGSLLPEKLPLSKEATLELKELNRKERTWIESSSSNVPSDER